jgi:hypothetical protein
MAAEDINIRFKKNFIDQEKNFINSFLYYYVEYFQINDEKLNEFNDIDLKKYNNYLLLYQNIFITNNSKLYLATSSRINAYINYYSIDPKYIDELKIIFFLGVTVADFLEQEGKQEIMHIHMSIMISMLDYRLYTKNIERKTLTDNLLKTIKNNQVKENFGKYGIYLTYRCLFNSAK